MVIRVSTHRGDQMIAAIVNYTVCLVILLSIHTYTGFPIRIKTSKVVNSSDILT